MAPLIAITGATGFIGSNLCFRLRASGFRVRALVRSPGQAQSLVRAGVDIVPGDLAAPLALGQLLAGCAAVIHCAGTVRGRTLADFAPANVLGNRHLIQAIKMSDTPPRLLALSSLAAREPQLSPYAASKFAGEQVVTASGDTVAWTILRPPAVYGPGDRELLPLFRLMARGIAPLPGRVTDRVSVLYIDDLATVVLRWLATEFAATANFYAERSDGRGLQLVGYRPHCQCRLRAPGAILPGALRGAQRDRGSKLGCRGAVALRTHVDTR